MESIPTLNSILDAPGDTSAGRELHEIKYHDRGAPEIWKNQASLCCIIKLVFLKRTALHHDCFDRLKGNERWASMRNASRILHAKIAAESRRTAPCSRTFDRRDDGPKYHRAPSVSSKAQNYHDCRSVYCILSGVVRPDKNIMS